jgi:hypothetical protein
MTKDLATRFDELEDLLHSIKNEVDVLKILVIEIQDFLKFKEAINVTDSAKTYTSTQGGTQNKKRYLE